MNLCKVYKTDREYIVVTTSVTENWIRIDDDPIFRISIEDNNNKLIESVVKAFENTRINIPDIPVEDFPNWQRENLRKMGQKSYTALYKNSNSCSVSRTEDKVKISPYKPRILGKLTQGLEVAKEGIIEIDWDNNNLLELEKILISTLNQDYKR